MSSEIKPHFSQPFAYDIALAFDPPETVCQNHDVSPEMFARLQADEAFTQTVSRFHKLQREEGKLASVLAGAVLDDIAVRELRKIIMDGENAPETRQKGIELLHKLSGRDKIVPVQEGGGFVLNMNFTEVQQPVGMKSAPALMPSFVDTKPVN